MAILQRKESNRRSTLEPDCLIGRSAGSALQIPEKFVSSQHASIRWSGTAWELKDLGSRNGTYLNGERVRPGEPRAIHRGDEIAIGRTDQLWLLTDESAPEVMALPLGGGEGITLDGDLLAVPSSEDPRLTIYRGSEGQWLLEQPDDATTHIFNQQTFEVDGRPWRFCCPEVTKTSLAEPLAVRNVAGTHLRFAVSSDEEHVELHAECCGQHHDLGARTHNYLLLILARRRLADQEEGLSDASCGWVYLDDLAHDPSMAPPQLNIDVFRIRRHFAVMGLVDAASVIERRPRTKQLRLGTGRITITRL